MKQVPPGSGTDVYRVYRNLRTQAQGLVFLVVPPDFYRGFFCGMEGLKPTSLNPRFAEQALRRRDLTFAQNRVVGKVYLFAIANKLNEIFIPIRHLK